MYWLATYILISYLVGLILPAFLFKDDNSNEKGILCAILFMFSPISMPLFMAFVVGFSFSHWFGKVCK